MSKDFRSSASIWNATRTLGFLAVSMTLTTALLTDAFAQEGVRTVGYYTNANSGAPDSRMSVVNPGSVNGFSPAGDLCANIYVFTPDQQMVECCSCIVTPDGLRTFSVNTDLTGNPLISATLHSGAIKIVSSAAPNDSCSVSNSAVPLPIAATGYTPSGLLGSWITHANDAGNGTYSISETNFFPGALAANELHKLQAQCNAISQSNSVGSVHGICSCGSE